MIRNNSLTYSLQVSFPFDRRKVDRWKSFFSREGTQRISKNLENTPFFNIIVQKHTVYKIIFSKSCCHYSLFYSKILHGLCHYQQNQKQMLNWTKPSPRFHIHFSLVMSPHLVQYLLHAWHFKDVVEHINNGQTRSFPSLSAYSLGETMTK